MKNNKVYIIAVLALSIMVSSVHAAKTKGDAKAGEMASALCQGCHGGDGNSEMGSFPRLAGQYENYIVKQIKDFKSGKRANNDTMSGMAMTVATVKDAHDIAAYFASKKMAKKPIVEVNQALLAAGEELYRQGKPRQGVYGCINCHGERGKGKSKKITQFPRIGGQHREYLIKQLTDLRSGARKNDPAGMMRDIARALTDKDIAAVSEYLAAQLP